MKISLMQCCRDRYKKLPDVVQNTQPSKRESMKYKLFLLMLMIPTIIFADNKSKIAYEVSMGSNYSELYTTDNTGDYGINFGVYRRRIFNNNWQIKTGIRYVTKSSKLENVVVFPMYMIDWYSDNYLYWRNFELDYTYINVNSALEIPLFKKNNFMLCTLAGIGFEFNNSQKTKMVTIKHELYNIETDSYDYTTNDHDAPPFATLFENNSVTYHFGGELIFKKLVLSFYYEKSIFGISYIDNMKFGEKFHTYNTTLGFLIK